MKKMTAMFLALLLAILTLNATAEMATATDLPDPYGAELFGTITGWTEDGAILLHALTDGQTYQVNIDPDVTRTEDAPFLALGDCIYVLYDGKLTRSIPAQLTASYIGCFKLTGTVSGFDEADEGVFYLDADDGQTYAVDATNVTLTPAMIEGTSVTVYYTGMMTRSIPAQINALHVRPIHFAGQIVAIERDDEGQPTAFLMTDEYDVEVLVGIAPELTLLYTELAEGEMVVVSTTGMMTMSLPAQVTAVEVLSMAAPAL